MLTIESKGPQTGGRLQSSFYFVNKFHPLLLVGFIPCFRLLFDSFFIIHSLTLLLRFLSFKQKKRPRISARDKQRAVPYLANSWLPVRPVVYLSSAHTLASLFSSRGSCVQLLQNESLPPDLSACIFLPPSSLRRKENVSGTC